MKNANKNNTSFEDNAGQNGHLSYYGVFSTLLCPELYCVQHIIVTSKILCPHLHKEEIESKQKIFFRLFSFPNEEPFTLMYFLSCIIYSFYDNVNLC